MLWLVVSMSRTWEDFESESLYCCFLCSATDDRRPVVQIFDLFGTFPVSNLDKMYSAPYISLSSDSELIHPFVVQQMSAVCQKLHNFHLYAFATLLPAC